MSERFILGIDPGITGALAWLDASSLRPVDVADMPTELRGKEGKKQQVSGPGLGVLLKLHPVSHAYLELVSGLARGASGRGTGMGLMGAFHIGGSYHGVRVALGVLGIPVTLITPVVWKKKAGLVGADDKDLSRTRAIQLFPTMYSHLRRKKDIGRAEALLIGYYGARIGEGS